MTRINFPDPNAPSGLEATTTSGIRFIRAIRESFSSVLGTSRSTDAAGGGRGPRGQTTRSIVNSAQIPIVNLKSEI